MSSLSSLVPIAASQFEPPSVSERSGFDFRVAHDWSQDLAYGEQGEQQAQALLGAIAGGATIEVKRERWAFRSGLVFCEFGRRGRRLPAFTQCEQFQRVVDFEPSGLAASQADWVVYLFGGTQVYLPRLLVLAKMRAVYEREQGKWLDSNGSYGSDRVRWRVGDALVPTHGVLLTPEELLLLVDDAGDNA